MNVAVTHDESRQRFEATVDGHLCVCDYQLRGNVMWTTPPGVPAAVGGRGIAAELVRVALSWADAKGLRVVPSCSYVDAYMRRHPETQKLRGVRGRRLASASAPRSRCDRDTPRR